MTSVAGEEYRPPVRVNLTANYLGAPETAEDCLVEYEVTITITDDDDERIQIGTAHIIVVDVETANLLDESLLTVLDIHPDTAPYVGLIDKSGCRWRKPVMSALNTDTVLIDSFLIVNRLEIAPAHRGHGYGLEAIAVLLARFRWQCGAAVLLPFPPQFEHGGRREPSRGLDRYQLPERAATQKLRDHYAQLGFMPVKSSRFMALNLALF